MPNTPDYVYPYAVQTPGPANKAGYSPPRDNTQQGVILHSAEGYSAGMYSRLNGSDQVSWHFSVYKDGSVAQHYPVNAQCWHAETPANYHYIGVESEGVAGEPLTPQQIDALVSLLKWLSLVGDWPGFIRHDTLYEHNEFVHTSCPSGRIPWDTLISRLTAPVSGNSDNGQPDAPVVSPPSPPATPPSPEALLRGFVAAAFVMSIGHPLSDLGPEDQEAIRFAAANL